MLLGMAIVVAVVGAFNTARGEPQYNAANATFFLLILGLFVLNRRGFVTAAGSLTVALTAAGSFFLIDENLRATYITLPIPILIASFLLVSWGGFVVSALVIACAIVLGIASLELLVLVIVATISYLIADSLERAYRESYHRAFHDPLTGLPNRALFLDRLKHAAARAARDQRCIAVLFMDVDNFKAINDSLGHDLGDDLLVQISRRLRGCVRPGDTAARLSGDEFTVLLEEVAHASDAVYVAERIADELQKTFDLDGREIAVTASTGIALNDPSSEQPTGLLRDADVAMYQAKKAKMRYKVFHPDMHEKALERLELKGDLRRAIEKKDFRVYYQPKVLLDTGRIAGVEALVRWGSPERGLVMPCEFVPFAEETGMILSIGEQVLEEACRQAREWEERHALPPEWKVCVNLSARQFQNPELLHDVGRVLHETGLQANRLQLEITESMVMEHGQRAVDTLRELKSLGIKIAIDDFGTGYSSLSYLKDLPVDSLKIDKSFVRGLGEDEADTAIVGLVINLAHTLNLDVTAEGVENDRQLTRLLQMGCDLGQGYYFSRPLPSEEAGALMATNLPVR